MEYLVHVVFNILTLVSILMMVGLGLAIIYGLMDIINFAHGEFVTIGAYSLVFVHNLGGSFWLALLIAPIVGFIFGIVLERTIVRYLYARPLAIVLATWGISLMVRQSIQLMFGARVYAVNTPVSGSIFFLGVEYPAYRLFLIASAFIIMIACYIIFRYTNFGLDVRTVIQNKEMAAALGINTQRIYLIAFGSGAALAAVAGVLIAPLVAILPQIGLNFLAKSFFVVIVGGVGNITGIVAGSFLIGGLETLLNYQIPVSLSQALVLIVAIVIVRFRPQGLVPI
jgi:branched-chain amino acid transport system permease protein/urea transport system permease protein